MLMEILDLNEFADRRVKTYSGGQRRRLDVALGIVHEPEVLFLDEPSTDSIRRIGPISGITSARCGHAAQPSSSPRTIWRKPTSSVTA